MISVKEIINYILYCIAPYLASVFNKCINDGVYPDLMKLNKVSPLFKFGTVLSLVDPTNS